MKKMMEAREDALLKLKKLKEDEIRNAPEGFLRIHNKKNVIQYYHRTDPKDFNGKYIRKENLELAKKLAQKDYDTKILNSLNKELYAIQQYNSNFPQIPIEQIYESLSSERQKIVIPIIKPEDEFVRNWESVTYQGKPFSEDCPEIYTAKDERVRSKSEVMIADLLNREGIPYRYEYPIYIKGWGIIYPDFTTLNVRKRKEMIFEHFGQMDNPDYAEKTVRKINTLIQAGYIPGENLIMTFETKSNPLNQRQVLQLINHFLK